MTYWRNRVFMVLGVLGILTLSLLGGTTWGTSFVPTAAKTLIAEADAVVLVKFIQSHSVRLPSGLVATRHQFQLLEEVGINWSKAVEPRNFTLYSPGGEYQGRGHQVPGSPQFNENEKSYLLVKKNSEGLFILGLSAGKYTIVNRNQKKFLVNNAFPLDHKFGNITETQFKDLVRERFGKPMTSLSPEKQKVTRVPASIVNINENPESKKIGHSENDFNSIRYLLILIFSVLGIYSFKRAKGSS